MLLDLKPDEDVEIIRTHRFSRTLKKPPKIWVKFSQTFIIQSDFGMKIPDTKHLEFPFTHSTRKAAIFRYIPAQLLTNTMTQCTQNSGSRFPTRAIIFRKNQEQNLFQLDMRISNNVQPALFSTDMFK